MAWKQDISSGSFVLGEFFFAFEQETTKKFGKDPGYSWTELKSMLSSFIIYFAFELETTKKFGKDLGYSWTELKSMLSSFIRGYGARFQATNLQKTLNDIKCLGLMQGVYLVQFSHCIASWRTSEENIWWYGDIPLHLLTKLLYIIFCNEAIHMWGWHTSKC